MTKQLVITYGGVTLYEDEPTNFAWRETSTGAIRLDAGPDQPAPAQNSGGGGNPLAGLLNGLQRAQQQQQQQTQATQIEQ